MPPKRPQRAYDHRLVRLVQGTGDPGIATRLGVPRSTAAGWLARSRRDVTTAATDDEAVAELRHRVAILEKRNRRLTPAEVLSLRHLVTSDDYRHVPTSRLALLAQRLACVFVSASTLCTLVRVRGWRRPRARVHPESPEVGVRASRPNEICRSRNPGWPGTPSTDPYVRDSLIRLLPQVVTHSRSIG